MWNADWLITTCNMDEVADVNIEPNGVFKYILIELTEKGKKSTSHPRKKIIVRGFEWAEYHGMYYFCKLIIS